MDIFELLYVTIDQMVWMYWLYNRERNTKIVDKTINNQIFIYSQEFRSDVLIELFFQDDFSLKIRLCIYLIRKNNDLYYRSFHFVLNQISIILFNTK